MKIVINIPLAQVTGQRNIKEKAFNDGFGFQTVKKELEYFRLQILRDAMTIIFAYVCCQFDG
jgi:hypothetical protein